MRQKIFLYRARRGAVLTKEELANFDAKVNAFHDKVNIKASQVQLIAAYEHLFLVETVWFDDSGKKDLPKSKDTKPPKGHKGNELGALWRWKRDGTLRGTFRDVKVDISDDDFRENAEIKQDKDGNDFYIYEIEGERVLIFPNLKKEKSNQPDYRIYEG